jgi:hypothetical protein
LQHREVRREVQREFPAFLAVLLRGFAGRLDRVARQPGQLGFVLREYAYALVASST